MTSRLTQIIYLEWNLNSNEHFYALPFVYSFSSSGEQFFCKHQKIECGLRRPIILESQDEAGGL